MSPKWRLVPVYFIFAKVSLFCVSKQPPSNLRSWPSSPRTVCAPLHQGKRPGGSAILASTFRPRLLGLLSYSTSLLALVSSSSRQRPGQFNVGTSCTRLA
ncbi:hypothetical protein BJX63DRAFT_24915 [Aspergillus granulosus]|uniref:Secreted protein n=1 Tax=Aspergillus granulosus TaxID=176169 RepID=A0ABR4H172_9EURO